MFQEIPKSGKSGHINPFTCREIPDSGKSGHVNPFTCREIPVSGKSRHVNPFMCREILVSGKSGHVNPFTCREILVSGKSGHVKKLPHPSKQFSLKLLFQFLSYRTSRNTTTKQTPTNKCSFQCSVSVYTTTAKPRNFPGSI
jgi:hypothetical protein